MEAPRGAYVALGSNVGLAGSYDMHLEKLLHYYLTWAASDPILFSGKI